MRILLPAIAFFALFEASYGADVEPDFYLMMNRCKTVVGYLANPERPMAQTDPKPIHFVCFRKSQNVECDLVFSQSESGTKGPRTEFTVMMDIPPSLFLANKHFGDFVAINSTTHTAVVITRMLDDEYAGSKVCHGTFATAFEMDKILELGK